MMKFLTLSLVLIAGALASPAYQGRIKAKPTNEVCYDNYGCFSTDSPWTSGLRPLAALPGRPEEVGTRHLLFTRTTRNEEEELIPGKDALLQFSQYSGARRTVVIIHGWTDSSTTEWVVNTKNALLDREDLNILVVDWHPGASQSYLKGVGNARLVGSQVAKLLDFIISKTETTPAKIHIIGHSLGAHIAGYVGNRIGGISRITAMDPTQPYFEGTDPLVRIDEKDALFVEGLHTNAKAALEMGFGMTSPVGNIDIYPNGGDSQPGCKDALSNIVGSIIELITLDFKGAISQFACSHSRAPEYFAEALKSECPFISYHCDTYKNFEKGSCFSCEGGSCLVIGDTSENFAHAVQPGKYFLHTDKQAAYCLQSANMESGVSSLQSKVSHGKVTVQLRHDGVSTDTFILAEGAISAGDNLSAHIEVPSAFLPTVGIKLTATLHYARTGLTPILDPKTLAINGLSISFLDKDFGLQTKRFYGVTMEAGVDITVTEEK